MEEIRQEIQDSNYNYLFNIYTPNTNILDSPDETINYIEAFLKTRHSDTGTPTTPIIQIAYPDAQEHITPDIRAEARANTIVTATASALNASSPTNISTLDPESPLSCSTEEPSNFLSTNPPYKPKEDPTSISDSTISGSPRAEPSHCPETSPTEITAEGLTSIIASDQKLYSPSEDTPSLHYLIPYDLPTEEPTLLLASEPNFHSPIEYPSRFQYIFHHQFT